MSQIKAYGDNILCVDGDFGEKTTSAGIIIQKTIGKAEGITPRWFRVFEVGPDVESLQPGQWVFVEFGRWTEGFTVEDERFDTDNNKKTVWKIDPKGCMAVSDEMPDTLNVATDVVSAQQMTRY